MFVLAGALNWGIVYYPEVSFLFVCKVGPEVDLSRRRHSSLFLDHSWKILEQRVHMRNFRAMGIYMKWLFQPSEALEEDDMALIYFFMLKMNTFLLLSWIISLLVEKNFMLIFLGFKEGTT